MKWVTRERPKIDRVGPIFIAPTPKPVAPTPPPPRRQYAGDPTLPTAPSEDQRIITIDTNIQQQADKVLDRPGSIVMIDPRDNSIVALVSKPTYDPNGFIVGFSDADWKKLSEDKNQPFQPRATMSTYPTGSVFKTVTENTDTRSRRLWLWAKRRAL